MRGEPVARDGDFARAGRGALFEIESGGSGGPAAKRLPHQCLSPAGLLPRPFVGGPRHRGRLGPGREGLTDRGIQLVLGKRLTEDSELFGSEELDGGGFDQRVLFLQEPVEPVEGVDAEFLGVAMRALGDLQPELFALSVEFIDPADLGVDADDSIEREDAVLVGVGDQQGTRGHECGDLGVVPAEGVDLEHAVAVAFDAAVDHMVGQVGDPGHRHRDLDPVVERRDPPAVGSATRAAGDADPVAVDLGSRLQVVQGPDAVPRLDSRRRVASSVPPPLAVTVGAVMDPLDLAQLKRVDRQAGVAVAGEPGTVVLVVHLVAVADSVLLDPPVATDVENRRQGAAAFLGQVEIAGDVQTGAGLELEVFDDEIGVLDPAGDLRLERGSGRTW